MTTICYKDGIIAFDSLLTRSDMITDRNFHKHYTEHGMEFFMTGAVCDYEEFFEVAAGKQKARDGIQLEVEALMIKEGKIYHCAVGDEFWKSPVYDEDIISIGSGSNFAYGAMDCGCSAEEAVKVAANRDIYTGGVIRTFNIKEEINNDIM